MKEEDDENIWYHGDAEYNSFHDDMYESEHEDRRWWQYPSIAALCKVKYRPKTFKVEETVINHWYE